MKSPDDYSQQCRQPPVLASASSAKDVNLKSHAGQLLRHHRRERRRQVHLPQIAGAGDIEPTGGTIEITPGERLAVLQQDHYAYDDYEVLRTVIMRHKRLVEIMDEKDALYANPDFSEEDGMRASELEAEFAELNG